MGGRCPAQTCRNQSRKKSIHREKRERVATEKKTASMRSHKKKKTGPHTQFQSQRLTTSSSAKSVGDKKEKKKTKKKKPCSCRKGTTQGGEVLGSGVNRANVGRRHAGAGVSETGTFRCKNQWPLFYDRLLKKEKKDYNDVIEKGTRVEDGQVSKTKPMLDVRRGHWVSRWKRKPRSGGQKKPKN